MLSRRPTNTVRYLYKDREYIEGSANINGKYIIINSPVGRIIVNLNEVYTKDMYNITFDDMAKIIKINDDHKIMIGRDSYQNLKTIIQTQIGDEEDVSPTYSVSPSSVNVNEGSTITYTITTTNVDNGTTLYWTNSGTTVAGDFSDSINSGSFTITSNSGTITRALTNDVSTEGSETVILQIRTISTSGTIVATASTVTIGDTSLTPATGGSMVFNYNVSPAGTYVRYANDSNLAIGSSSFTIEWFQYWQTGGAFPRVFSIGSYPTANIAVSYEGTTFYFWKSNSAIASGTVPSKNSWVHVAIVGSSGSTIKIYVDGVQRGSTISSGYNFTNNSTALTIGNESTASSGGGFTGKITNFRWVKGTEVYTTNNFTVPSTPLTAISGTELLLSAIDNSGVVTDSSSRGRTPTNTGVTFSSDTPF
jgi:hypothetical protein